MNPFILAAIEWICGFLAGAATVHCINYRRRHADKRNPSEEDIRAITASIMQTIDSTPCGDPDCPVCRGAAGTGAFLTINSADQMSRTVIPDKDTKH